MRKTGISLLFLLVSTLSFADSFYPFVKADNSVDSMALKRSVDYLYNRVVKYFFEMDQAVKTTDSPTFKDVSMSSRPVCTFSYWLWYSSITTINTAGVFELVCGTGTLISDSAWFNALPDRNGNNNKLTYAGTKAHKFQITITGCIESPSNTTTPYFRIYKNGQWLNIVEVSPFISTLNKDVAFSMNTVTTLTNGDYIELYASSEDADDLALDHAQISIIPID